MLSAAWREWRWFDLVASYLARIDNRDIAVVLTKIFFVNHLQTIISLGWGALFFLMGWCTENNCTDFKCTTQCNCTRWARRPRNRSQPPVTVLLPPWTPWSSFACFWTWCKCNSIEYTECMLSYLAPFSQNYVHEIHLCSNRYFIFIIL